MNWHFPIFILLTISLAHGFNLLGLEKLIPSRVIDQDTTKVEFFLYPAKESLGFREELILNDTYSLKNSKYRRHWPVIFLIHGFVSDTKEESGFADTVKDAYLREGTQANIIAVDWSDLSTPKTLIAEALYKFATLNVKHVGMRVSDFIQFLIREGYLSGPENVHIVGFSLGAQVAGKVGRYFNMSTGNLIHRITGLDPAGPVFNLKFSDAGRLDGSDAEFVDAYHTNIGQNGYYGVVGDVDFYPNGGGPKQPNCSVTTVLTGGCSHSAAYRYFAKSIREHNIMACRCNQTFLNSNCLEPCEEPVVFGEHCPETARGVYYLEMTYDPIDIGVGLENEPHTEK